MVSKHHKNTNKSNEITQYSISVKFTCAQPFLILANVFYIQIMASGNLPSQRIEVDVRRDRHCFCGVIALWHNEISDEKHDEIRRLY